jgi:hypothetical protein
MEGGNERNNEGKKAKREEGRSRTIIKYLTHAVLHSNQFLTIQFPGLGVGYGKQIQIQTEI